MFKKSKFFIIVDSVESAIKFYAEKLLFTVIKIGLEPGANKFINYAELRRGKCLIIVRIPALAELAEFSMVRRVNSRAAGLYLEIKEGLEKFYNVCKKKKINIISELSRHTLGYSYFQIADPFGGKIYIYQEDQTVLPLAEQTNILGYKLTPEELALIKDNKTPAQPLEYIKGLGVSRRVAKKYLKAWYADVHEA